MPSHQIPSLTVETQETDQATFGKAMSVRGINRLLMVVDGNQMQNGTLEIGCQQSGVNFSQLTLLLRQELRVVFKHRVLHRPLRLSS
ncbi:hypothetical protein D3C81_449270 [compost metagenome]